MIFVQPPVVDILKIRPINLGYRGTKCFDKHNIRLYSMPLRMA